MPFGPLNTVTAEEVREFLDSAPAEGDTLELKETLPAKRGASDPWISGGDRIGDYARDKLLKELIAFANAHGGLLMVGVEETDTHPKRAAALHPIPKCAELATRLRQQADDCVEPPIPIVEIEGVPTEEDGSGVILMRVPASRRAPHRLNQDKECYIRRADRSESMTMREIQELVYLRASDFEKVERTFEIRHEQFVGALREHLATCTNDRRLLGMRVTAIPTSADIFIERVYGNQSITPRFDHYNAKLGTRTVNLRIPPGGVTERPILRGARTSSDTDHHRVDAEVHCSGLVEYCLIERVNHDREDMVYPEWIGWLAMNTLLAADAVRRTAGAPAVEYGFEVSCARIAEDGFLNLRLGGWGEDRIFEASEIRPNPLILPRMSFGHREEIPQLLNVMLRDLFNAAGIDVGDARLEVELPGV